MASNTTPKMIALALGVVSMCPSILFAQGWPNKPIRLIVPSATGGPADTLGRIVALNLAERLGQPVVTENRPGAGGNIGIEVVAKAKPDGYTIVLGTTALAISSSLYKKINYDPIKDFAPISLVTQIPIVVLVRPSSPIKDLKELVEYAKANPGKLNYASAGLGTGPQLAFELLKNLAKINIVHVPYKGGPQALVGLMGGEVDMQVTPSETALLRIQAGTVRALAVLRNERMPSLPNVQTAKEAGIDNLEVNSWYGILAPAGTPLDIVNRLSAEWIKIEAMPSIKEQMQKTGFESLSGTPEQFSKFLKAETERWSKVIKEANIVSID
jgi:tripartite-type tricarboxylate transporter receptor subunit TctC